MSGVKRMTSTEIARAPQDLEQVVDETTSLPGQELDVLADPRRHMLIVTINNGGGLLMDIDEAMLVRMVGAGAVANAAVIFLTEPSVNIGRVFRDISTPDETLIISTAAVG